MKHTKLLSFVVGLIFIVAIGSKDVLAVIKLPNTKLRLVATNTPTPTPTKTAIATPTPELTTKPTAIITPTVTEEPTPTVAVPTAVQTSSSSQQNPGDSLTFWFLLVTIGLLAVIIVVQAWPRNDGEEKEE